MGRDGSETEQLALETGLSSRNAAASPTSDNENSAAACGYQTCASNPGAASRVDAADSAGLNRCATAVAASTASLVYIMLSSAMILFNKFLMRADVFPFPVTLTSLHMACSLMLAFSLQRLCPALFPAFPRVFGKRSKELDYASEGSTSELNRVMHCLLPFAPIAACGAVALICGNSAYKYASVSFLQMVKESHIMFVYVLMLAVGLDNFKLRMAACIIFVTVSAMVAVYGEMHFSWQGLALQLLSGLSGSGQIVLNNLLMSRRTDGKVDPLTLVFCTAPVMLIALIPANVLLWDSSISMQFTKFLPYIACNAVLAFALQVSAATLIWVTSGTGYALACVAKDLAIVAAAQVLLHESFTMIQVLGFAGSIAGMVLYSAMKLFPEAFEPAA